MALPIYILNGPNLNFLGVREPETYGANTLQDVQDDCEAKAKSLGAEVDFRQTNHEGTLVDWLQEAHTKASAVVLNAGAYTHTSVAIADAIRAISTPVIELHISNVHAREEFRLHSFLSEACAGVMVGFGTYGYELAVQAAAHLNNERAD